MEQEWIDPYEGFVYRTETIVVTAEEQEAKLSACGLSSARYEGYVDPAFYIGLAIRAGIKSGISAEGNINMVQSLTQHRPVRLGEPLTVYGSIDAIEQVPRGRTVDTRVWFEDAEGNRAISASRKTLKPDPSKVGTRGAGERPPPVVTDIGALEPITQHELTPDAVKAYSSEGNAIHYDMDAATQAGFRAPMIGGGMGVHFLIDALARPQLPTTLELSLYFRRPIFWDERFNVSVDPKGNTACLWKLDGTTPKVLTEAAIHNRE